MGNEVSMNFERRTCVSAGLNDFLLLLVDDGEVGFFSAHA